MLGNGAQAAQLQEELARAQSEKGAADKLIELLNAQVAAAREENFDLLANMATVEAEIRYDATKKEEELAKQIAGLESKCTFMSDDLKNTERAKLHALRKIEELEQRLLVEQKRLEAEKRLLVNKQRRKESAMFAASQSSRQSQQLSQSQSVPPSLPTNVAAPHPTTSIAVQTNVSSTEKKSASDVDTRLAVENRVLVTALVNSISRDLLVMLRGSNSLSTTEDGSSASSDPILQALSGSQRHSHDTPEFGQDSDPSAGVREQTMLSQSIFSQMAGHSAAGASETQQFAPESDQLQSTLTTECAQELYDTIGKMLDGKVSAVALVPIFIKYLASPTDLDNALLCSVLRVMYSIIFHSGCFRQFLLLSTPVQSSVDMSRAQEHSSDTSSLMEHPRISVPGLHFTSLDDYLSARSDQNAVTMEGQPSSMESASEQRQLRAKLLSALCRAIKNNVVEPTVAEAGLDVLSSWIACGTLSAVKSQPDFRPIIMANVIQDVVLAPKSALVAKAKAIAVTSQLLQFPDLFDELQASAKKSLLFNRCAKMLDKENVRVEKPHEMRLLQREIVKLFLSIVLSFPSMGIRFLLDSTRGHVNDADGHRSVVYYVARLMDYETFEARLLQPEGGSPAGKLLLNDDLRVDLLRKAFQVIALLARYVDLGRELDGADREMAFISSLYYLSSANIERNEANGSIAKTALAMIEMVKK